MGLEIGSQEYPRLRPSPASTNSPKSVSEKTNPQPHLRPKPLPDVVDSGRTITNQQTVPAPTLNSPMLLKPRNLQSDNSDSELIRLIKNTNLPNKEDLENTLSNDLLEKIAKTLSNFETDFDLDLKQFFNILSKLYPYSLSILSSLLGADGKELRPNFLNEALKQLQGFGKLISHYSANSSLPKGYQTDLDHLAAKLSGATPDLKQAQDVKRLLERMENAMSQENRNDQKLIAELETFLSDVKNDLLTSKIDPKLLKTLQEKQLFPNAVEKNQFSAKELKSALNQLRANSKHPLPALVQKTSELFGLIYSLKQLSKEDQKLALTTHLANFRIERTETALGLLGPNLNAIAENIGQFIHQILTQSEQLNIAKRSDAEQYYAAAFKQLLLSGTLLGAMLSSHARKETTEEAVGFSLLKLNSVKELGIVDQIPFSFFAFFADLTREEEGDSEAIKSAKDALTQLIRLLLKLIFILSAIAAAGNKLGPKGMDEMLVDNNELIIGILDDLTFALKKVDENVFINVNTHLALLQSAKDSLALKNYETFWNRLICMFAVKTELTVFLKEMKDAEPLFNTLKALIGEGQLPFSHPLHT